MEETTPSQPPLEIPPSWPELINFWKTQDITPRERTLSSGNSPPFNISRRSSSAAQLPPLTPYHPVLGTSMNALPAPHACDPSIFAPPNPAPTTSTTSTPSSTTLQRPLGSSPRPAQLEQTAHAEMRGGEVLASGNSSGGSAPLIPATSAVGEVVVSGDQSDADPGQPTVARRKQSLRTLSFEEALKARQLVRTGSEVLR